MLVASPILATAAYYHNDGQAKKAFEVPNLIHFSVTSHAEKNVFDSLKEHGAGQFDKNVRTITASEVRASKDRVKTGGPIYVTYGDGVYDISEFREGHPGGEVILLAAGGPLERYWIMYPQHANEFVLDLLEELRVGNLKRDEQWNKDYDKNGLLRNVDKKLAYHSDPERHPSMIVQSTAPYTAEPPASALVAHQRTPNDLFYVRNHMPVPIIKEEEYELKIVDKYGKHVKSVSMHDLKTKFQKVSVDATVQCAGNRRNELGRVRKVKGGGWELGAISNAQWGGVRLKDVLRYALNEESDDSLVTREEHGEHILFKGLDEDPVTGVCYGASIPMDIVRRHGENVILAYEMNGKVLPRDHGYPVRVVVPGVVGARHVKWLGEIRLDDKESDSHWQQKDYRSFSPDVDWHNVDFGKAPSIQEMPVVSAICTHAVDSRNGTVTAKGYAWSGDGKQIIRVDVSADGGKHWTAATLHDDGDGRKRRRNEAYDWTLWSASLKLGQAEKGQDMQLVCKAVDSAYNTQPDGAKNVWNLRGLLNNCWHRVDVDVDVDFVGVDDGNEQ